MWAITCAGHDEPAHASLVEDRLERRLLERVAVVLLDDGLAVAGHELGDDPPPVGAVPQLVVVVLQPDDRHRSRPSALDERSDVGDHRVAVVGVRDDVVLTSTTSSPVVVRPSSVVIGADATDTRSGHVAPLR